MLVRHHAVLRVLASVLLILGIRIYFYIYIYVYILSD